MDYTKKINELLIEEFGLNDGMRMAGTVLPNILSDFRKTKILKTLQGLNVSEEYRFDDRKGSIFLTGYRDSKNIPHITEIKINERSVKGDF